MIGSGDDGISDEQTAELVTSSTVLHLTKTPIMLQRTLRIGSASTSALVARPALCARPLARRPLAPIAARQCLPSRSLATAIPGQDGEKKGFRVSYLFGGLVGLGMLVTIYGL